MYKNTNAIYLISTLWKFLHFLGAQFSNWGVLSGTELHPIEEYFTV